MEESNLQAKYKQLTDDISDLNILKVRAETSVGSYKDQRKDVLAEIKKVAGTDDVKVAKEKLGKLGVKLEGYIEEAEGIIDAEQS